MKFFNCTLFSVSPDMDFGENDYSEEVHELVEEVLGDMVEKVVENMEGLQEGGDKKQEEAGGDTSVKGKLVMVIEMLWKYYQNYHF